MAQKRKSNKIEKKEVVQVDSRFAQIFEDEDDIEEEQLNRDQDDNEEIDKEQEEDEDEDEDEDDNIQFDGDEEEVEEGSESEETSESNTTNNKKVIKIKPMDIEKMKKLKIENENKGICYIPTIPPRMKPAKLKQLLVKYGKVTRMYLVRANVERKSHRNDMFKEGWIEFQDKGIARKVATLINNQPMGGKSRDIHKDVLWNIRYLPKFKWHHLQDKLISQRMERDKKLKLEINQVRKQNMALLEQVERSKHINQKHTTRGNNGGKNKNTDKVVRTFKQRSSHEDSKATISSSVLDKVVSNKKQKIN